MRQRTIPLDPMTVLFAVLIGALSAFIVLEALFIGPAVFDDAYMFARYGHNIIAGHGIVWNPGGEPTYGLTSLLYLLVVIPVQLALPDANAMIVVLLSSMLSGVAFLGLLAVLLWTVVAAERPVRMAAMALVFFGLAISRGMLTAHFASGMDTTFAMALLTLYMLGLYRCVRQPSRGGVLLVGGLGAALYLVRPDLMLYPAVMVGLLFLFDRARRGLALRIGLATGGFLGLIWLGLFSYFGTPLPLPFFAKQGGLYDEPVLLAFYAPIPGLMLVRFLLTYRLLTLGLVGAVLALRRRWWSALTLLDRGLLLATAIYIGYFWFFVLQIMPYRARFYHHALPAIALLTGHALALLLKQVSWDKLRQLRLAPARLAAISTVIGAVILFGGWFSIDDGALTFVHPVPNGDLLGAYRDGLPDTINDYWFRPLAFAQLNDEMTIATTEVGIPAIANYRHRIVDLAGLNEPYIIAHGFSAEWLLENRQPDLIFMPHEHYTNMNRMLIEHPGFAGLYEHYPPEALGTTLGLAIRRDSRYYSDLHAIVTAASG